MPFPLPDWFHTLRKQQHPDFQWWSDEDIARYMWKDKDIEFLLHHWRLTEDEYNDAFAMMKRSIRVGDGPIAYGMDPGLENDIVFWIDTQDPSQLLVALGSESCPLFWFPAGQDLASIQETLKQYHQPTGLYTAHCRLFTDAFVETSLKEIEDTLFLRPSFSGFQAMGTAPSQNNETLKITEIWTMHSQSFITLRWLELMKAMIAYIEYQPAQQQEVIARYNSSSGCDFPLDLPVDVAELLCGFSNLNAESMLQQFSNLQGVDIAFYLPMLVNILPDDPDVRIQTLMPFARHESIIVRNRLANIAFIFELDPLLRRQLEQETDEELAMKLLSYWKQREKAMQTDTRSGIISDSC